MTWAKRLRKISKKKKRKKRKKTLQFSRYYISYVIERNWPTRFQQTAILNKTQWTASGRNRVMSKLKEINEQNEEVVILDVTIE